MPPAGVLNLPDGEPFATGATAFFSGPLGTVTADRLMVKIAVEGQSVFAVVDTGAPYLVCEPDLADALESYLTDSLGVLSLSIRGATYRGELYRLSVEIPAEVGESHRFEATAFIPQLSPGQVWNLPSFIGWNGMLAYLRFAVDPSTNTFYFGPLT